MRTSSTIVLLMALAPLGCDGEPANELTDAALQNAAAVSTMGASAREAMPDVDARDLSGTVVERHRVSTYSYLRIEADGATHWVMTLGDGEPIGTEVTVHSVGVGRRFRSRKLDRTFDGLRFGIVRAVDPQ